jgi:hypothetical protein
MSKSITDIVSLYFTEGVKVTQRMQSTQLEKGVHNIHLDALRPTKFWMEFAGLDYDLFSTWAESYLASQYRDGMLSITFNIPGYYEIHMIEDQNHYVGLVYIPY